MREDERANSTGPKLGASLTLYTGGASAIHLNLFDRKMYNEGAMRISQEATHDELSRALLILGARARGAKILGRAQGQNVRAVKRRLYFKST